MSTNIKGYVAIILVFALGVAIGYAAFVLEGPWRIGILAYVAGACTTLAVGLHLARKRGNDP